MTTWIKLQLEDGTLVKEVKSYVESIKLLNKNKKIDRVDNLFNIYTKSSEKDKFKDLCDKLKNIKICYYEEIIEEQSLFTLTKKYLIEKCKVDELNIDALLMSLPKKWSIYPPMLLLGFNSYDAEVWVNAFSSVVDQEDYFKYILSSGLFPLVTHIAINKPIIEEDVMRRPFNLVPLFGNFGPSTDDNLFNNPSRQDLDDAFWCTVKQNGIFQTWAPRYTMFSRGNIKEKKRILDNFKNLDKLVVFDLYGGIGYFTLSYLKNNAQVFCWEINPWSIEGLIRGVSKANYKYKVITRNSEFNEQCYEQCLQQGVKLFIFYESNEFAPLRISKLNRKLPIKHINLGLLPTSFDSWCVSNSLVSKYSNESVIIHVHENVHIDEFEEIKKKVLRAFDNSQFLKIEKVKTFAPDIWHIVIDILVEKN